MRKVKIQMISDGDATKPTINYNHVSNTYIEKGMFRIKFADPSHGDLCEVKIPIEGIYLIEERLV